MPTSIYNVPPLQPAHSCILHCLLEDVRQLSAVGKQTKAHYNSQVHLWQARRPSASSLHFACRKVLVVPRAEAEAAELPASETEKSGNSFQALKDIEAIQDILPHR